MQPTELLYLEDFSRLENTAKILAVNDEGEKKAVILDKTVFYPQGGGQPYDNGVIKGEIGVFRVEEVRFQDGFVKHIGSFEKGELSEGAEVKCNVDPDRRRLNSRLHSAGHVVDAAVDRLEYNWTPGKGYHFPDGPYVEYIGSISENETEREEIRQKIETTCNQIIQESIEPKIQFMKKEKMSSVCRFVPEHMPDDKPGRVILYGNFGAPCGGTHVSNLKEIGNISIPKIKTKKGNIRISYITQ